MIPSASGVCIAASAESRLTSLVPPAALDVQLRESLLQRSLNGRDFFRTVILFHRRLRAGHGCFGSGFIDRGWTRAPCRSGPKPSRR